MPISSFAALIAAGSGSPASTESASLIASTRCFIPRAAEPADAPDDCRAVTMITPSAGVGDVKAVAAARTPPAGGGAAAVCTSAGASASGGAAGVPAARPHSPLELLQRVYAHPRSDDVRRQRVAALLGWLAQAPPPVGPAITLAVSELRSLR